MIDFLIGDPRRRAVDLGQCIKERFASRVQYSPALAGSNAASRAHEQPQDRRAWILSQIMVGLARFLEIGLIQHLPACQKLLKKDCRARAAPEVGHVWNAE